MRGAGMPSGAASGAARANRHRGEVEAIIDGERRILCLTLGSLAELETAFGAENLAALAARFAGGRLSAADIIRILAAGLRGGGNLIGEEEVAAMTVHGGLAGAARLVAELLAATFGVDGESDGEGRGQTRTLERRGGRGRWCAAGLPLGRGAASRVLPVAALFPRILVDDTARAGGVDGSLRTACRGAAAGSDGGDDGGVSR